jgi:hypothetical protein
MPTRTLVMQVPTTDGSGEVHDWIDIGRPERLADQLTRLRDAEAIVLEVGTCELEIDYPLSQPTKRVLSSPDGVAFTLGALVLAIDAAYRAIYAEEEGATTIAPADLPDSYNRNRTDGPHGSHGHYIDQLAIHEIEIDDSRHPAQLTLDMYS